MAHGTDPLPPQLPPARNVRLYGSDEVLTLEAYDERFGHRAFDLPPLYGRYTDEPPTERSEAQFKPIHCTHELPEQDKDDPWYKQFPKAQEVIHRYLHEFHDDMMDDAIIVMQLCIKADREGDPLPRMNALALLVSTTEGMLNRARAEYAKCVRQLTGDQCVNVDQSGHKI